MRARWVQVRMDVGGVAVALVALPGVGRPAPVRVALFSTDEAASGHADAWSTSTHAVFQCAPPPFGPSFCCPFSLDLSYISVRPV